MFNGRLSIGGSLSYIYGMKEKLLLNLFLGVAMGAMLGACGDKSSTAVEERCNCDFEFRESVAAMDWGDDTAYVFGHKTPDVDAVTSSLAYAALMRAMGHNAVAKVSSPVNRETEFVAKQLGFELPDEMVSVKPGTRLILTDHAEYVQSVDGAHEAKILQIIDHHTPGDIDADSSAYVRRELWGSTCTLIKYLYQEAGVKLDDEVAKILLAGILSDTRNLTKVNTTRADSVVLGELMNQLKMSSDSVRSLFRGMSEASHDMSGMTDKEIFLADYKDYTIGDFDLGIASENWYDDSTKDDFFERMFAVMPEIAKEKDRDILLSKVDLHTPNPDPAASEDSLYLNAGTYILYYGVGDYAEKAKEIAESAFGESVKEGICYSAETLSRKTHVVPMVTDAIEKISVQPLAK